MSQVIPTISMFILQDLFTVVVTFQKCTCRTGQSHPTLRDPTDYGPPGSSVHGIPGKNTGVGCLTLLQGIFPIRGSNLHLSCIGRWILLPLMAPGRPIYDHIHMHMMTKLLGFPHNPGPFAISLQSIRGIFMHPDFFLHSLESISTCYELDLQNTSGTQTLLTTPYLTPTLGPAP